jgi:hypothetical protein
MWCKLAHQKVLPEGFETWDQHSVESYLAGLLASDGCFTALSNGGTLVGLYLTSEVLVRQVSDLLLWRYGIVPASFISRVDDQNIDGVKLPRKHPLFGFHFSSLCEIRKLAPVFARMPGAKGRTARAALNKEEKQSNPYTKAYIRRGDHLGMVPCYDIEVDCADHLFVLANGLMVSNSTAKGGDLLKITTQSALDFNVTTPDCGATNGIAADSNDHDLTGRVLAQAVGNIPAGTVIDRASLAQLRRQNKPLMVRSAMTCRAPHGLCARCVGVKADGHFPNVGESVGVTASAAIFEPIVQNALNVKHQAGAAKGKKAFSGLAYITQFLQIPEEFKDRATVSEIDGTVDKIEEAPQGGTYITVGSERHFALPGFAPTVKVGQRVEAGDVMSDGLVNPADIVRLRGLGEGRKYYAGRLSQMLRDSGQKPDSRNVEIITRAALDNYLIEDPDEDSPWLPDDLVHESEFLARYRPPDDTVDSPVTKAAGKFLQAPTLHYTVGTRLTPSMTRNLETAGVTKVPVSSQQPWFRPEMQRLRVASHSSDDWLASLGTSYLSGQLRSALERGDATDVSENYHFGPRLAFGADAGKGGFGEHIEATGKF